MVMAMMRCSSSDDFLVLSWALPAWAASLTLGSDPEGQQVWSKAYKVTDRDPVSSLVAQMVKNPATRQEPLVRTLGIRKIPWRREWLPTAVFMPGEFRGQRSLAGNSASGHSLTQLSY